MPPTAIDRLDAAITATPHGPARREAVAAQQALDLGLEQAALDALTRAGLHDPSGPWEDLRRAVVDYLDTPVHAIRRPRSHPCSRPRVVFG